MADKKWLVTKRKRNRDIRDFIVVHGKIIKPSLHPASPSLAAPCKEKNRRQVALPQLRDRCFRQERRNERESKISAALFSKGVRKKAPLIEEREDLVGRGSEELSSTLTNCLKTSQHSPVVERSAGEENADIRPKSVIPNTAWKGKRSVRLPLSSVQSSSGCNGECPPKGDSNSSFPPITTATISPAVLHPPDMRLGSSHRLLTVADTPTHHPSRPHSGGHEDGLNTKTLPPHDALYTCTPSCSLFDLSLSLPESLQTPNLTSSWDTERLLAELSSCEKL